MFPQFASTAASFTRASSLVLKAGTDAHLYDDPHDADIVRLLDSKFDAEKVEALKRLLALISQGSEVSTFFPQVVKSVASPNLEVKKLVYIYLVHYAEKRPDEALLSINTFQKDLVDFNPLVRAWALRAMCGIRVRVVAPLMVMAIEKCAKDPSPYVRRCAANAIPKLHALNKEQNVDVLEELIGMLLDDKSAGVLGAAAAAFTLVCPENFRIVASRFQKLCTSLPDVEEWGQVLIVDILLRYVVAVYGYPKEIEKQETDGEDNVPHDTLVLLQCTAPLLWNHNSAVVLAAAGVHWLLAPNTQLKKIVKPLLFLMRSSYDTQYVVMSNLVTLVKTKPSLFEDFYDEFFIRSSDTHQVRTMKLEILALIATKSSIAAILQELQAYVRDPDRVFAANSVSAIGKCAARHPSIASTCMEGLLSLAQGGCKTSATNQDDNREAAVVTQAVLAIRSVASLDFKQVEKVFIRLIRELDLIKVNAARAVVIWMVGEYSGNSSMIRDILPTIFSYLAACFVNEEIESKLQILNCLTKVLVQSWKCLGASFKTALLALTYILDLGLCDGNYDVRDRARMLKQLMDLHRVVIEPDASEVSDLLSKVSLGKVSDAEMSSQNGLEASKGQTLAILPGHVLTFSKLGFCSMSTSQNKTFLPGSMSHLVNHSAPGYRSLPEPFSFEGDVTSSCDHPSNVPLNERQERSQELGKESDFSESDSSGLSTSEGDEDDNIGEVINVVNGLVDSHASESGSVSSNEFSGSERGFHDSSLHQDRTTAPLISLSDNEDGVNLEASASKVEEGRHNQPDGTGLSLRSSEDLESWLASDSSGNIKQLSEELRMPSGYMNLSMDTIKREPRKMTLLDFTNGEGLEVKYCFSFESSAEYDKMVWVKLSFANRSSDTLSAIKVEEWESEAAVTEAETSTDLVKPKKLVASSPEVHSLEPRQSREFDLHVDFQQQLAPVKLVVCCNQKCHVVKLVPDIGAFLRPKLLSFEDFAAAESRLVGMFETTNRCFVERPIRSQNFAVLDADEEALALARVLATRILSQVNVNLVIATIPVFSGDINDDIWTVHLKFSGETLLYSRLCLITITLEPESASDNTNTLPVLLKVNCEDSVFGLNLLNRLQKAVAEK